MRIGEVAAEAAVNIQTLRYYERVGLLPKPGRRSSGYRAYEPHTENMRDALTEYVTECRAGRPLGDCPLLRALDPPVVTESHRG